MRTLLALAAIAGTAACQPSATVRQQSPIANLRTQRVVAVHATGSGQWAQELEASVIQRVAGACIFDHVLPADQVGETPPDLVVDLKIHRIFRGGDGIIQNENKAVTDVLLTLSDADDDLLGSAWIRGESSGVRVSGSSPERQAMGAVAESVAKVMHASGCSLARIEPEPEPEPEPDTEPVSDNVAAAEALNDEGKELFKAADLQGAIAKFQAAIELAPDPRYYFNLCFTHEALKQYDDAIGYCQEVLARHPSERLRKKTATRIESIRKKQGK